MNFDLPLVPATCRLANSTFVTKREDGLLVPFVPALMLAYPANHLMQLTCEGSRYLRQVKLWQDAMEDPANASRLDAKVNHMQNGSYACMCICSTTGTNS